MTAQPGEHGTHPARRRSTGNIQDDDVDTIEQNCGLHRLRSAVRRHLVSVFR
ncbi:hypothetical protein OH799_04980 [Nocardia sp. NBC_00881]|uniref:hypothetical protein n=1 Tax=Nocardia sp. NBC_00881 TaxID=2975995 RepID=UPI0038703E59|nr:hypothetical protein OH799_04980 [Nocardia sp. NBC_00881]